MSAAAREAISDAANSVYGITCSPYYRQSTKAGSAFVRIDRITNPTVFGGLTTWQVLVLAPKALDQAEKYFEDMVPDLVTALAKELTVTSVTPSQIALDATTLPGLVIEGTRESE